MRLYDEGGALYNEARPKEHLQQAVEKYEQALRIFEEVNSCKGIGMVANNLRDVFSNWAQFDKAVENLE
ncbi:MAG: hypothetical protein ACLQPD_35855 [Desulfomonilaceae bacterium]